MGIEWDLHSSFILCYVKIKGTYGNEMRSDKTCNRAGKFVDYRFTLRVFFRQSLAGGSLISSFWGTKDLAL